jgi:hypothetical protein
VAKPKSYDDDRANLEAAQIILADKTEHYAGLPTAWAELFIRSAELNANQHFALRAEYGGVEAKIFELMEQLEVLSMLRAHVHTRKRHLVDRPETALRLREEIRNRIQASDRRALCGGRGGVAYDRALQQESEPLGRLRRPWRSPSPVAHVADSCGKEPWGRSERTLGDMYADDYVSTRRR